MSDHNRLHFMIAPIWFNIHPPTFPTAPMPNKSPLAGGFNLTLIIDLW